MSRKVKELRMEDVVFKPTLQPKKSEKKNAVQKSDSLSISKAIEIVNRQMQLQGLRHKTLLTYNQTMQKYVKFLKLETMDDINKEGFMNWLESLNHLDKTTQANRFRFVSAILTRFYDNGWLKDQGKFWKDIKIKVDKKVKKAADEKELEILLSLIDTTSWIGWRDVTVCCEWKISNYEIIHLVGQALDWVLVDANGNTMWNAYKTPNADKVINYAKKLGFESGWGWDAHHLQYDYKGYGKDTFGKIKENGDELTMSQFNHLKEMITALQKENTELEKQLDYKLDKQKVREPLKYHVDDWNWLKTNGITDGSNPQNYITREQISSILKKFEQYLTKKLS